jgi:hypothetical protein
VTQILDLLQEPSAFTLLELVLELEDGLAAAAAAV